MPTPPNHAASLATAPEPRQSERPALQLLVDSSANFFAGESCDDPLDLTPVAKTNDVSRVPADLGTSSSFEPGIVPEAVDKVGSISKRQSAIDVRSVHGR